jgi:hypothetical protein
MRRIIVGVCLSLWGACLAVAQSTTSTLVTTTSTSTPTSTATSTSLATSTSTSTTTTTSSTVLVEDYDPKQCAREATAKDACRQECCTAGYDMLVAQCDGDACGGDWDEFVDDWRLAGEFYKFCQNTDDDEADFEVEAVGAKFVEFNVDKSCRAYQFGCKKAARKHVRQCADAGRCVGCCRTVLRRWRAKAVRTVMRGGLRAACRQSVRCLRKATRKSQACRTACRRRPTCGESQFRQCLEAKPAGREVLGCYAKCAGKCENSDSYRWCLQACQGLDDCGVFDVCAERFDAGGPAGCLSRTEGECVPVTTTTTSTSSTTSSSSQSTSSTSSTTSTSSPLLVGPRLR